METVSTTTIIKLFDSLQDQQKRLMLHVFVSNVKPTDGDLRTKINQYLNTTTSITFESAAVMLGRETEAFKEFLLEEDIEDKS